MTPAAADWIEIFVAPAYDLFLLLALLALALAFRRPLARLLAELGVKRLSVFGVDVEWFASQAEEAYARRDLPPPSFGALRAYAVLSAHLAPLVRGRRVLWVDDNPPGNAIETRLLRKLGVKVQNALDTDTAAAWLELDPTRFDLVITDWARSGPEDSGPALLKTMRFKKIEVPAVFYVGVVSKERRDEASRLGAVGITREPDELLKLAVVELAIAD